MIETSVKMDLLGGGLYIPVRIWSVTENTYRWISLTLDTGASVTAISPEIFYQLGYEPAEADKISITTASGVERISRYKLEAVKIGDIELNNIEAYSHKFPEECFSIGVIGLNILRQFDICLKFSENIITLRKI